MKRSECANQRDETIPYTVPTVRPATEDVDNEKKASDDNIQSEQRILIGLQLPDMRILPFFFAVAKGKKVR